MRGKIAKVLRKQSIDFVNKVQNSNKKKFTPEQITKYINELYKSFKKDRNNRFMNTIRKANKLKPFSKKLHKEEKYQDFKDRRIESNKRRREREKEIKNK